MSKKRKRDDDGVVYSTSQSFEYDDYDIEPETLAPEEQRLKVRIEKKGRKGKTAVVVSGFEGTHSDLNDLAKYLKSSCGTGGSAKDGLIIIQGDMRDKVIDLLKNKGYKNTKRGGG